jgi:BMFP domain-containing protein YqiC
MRLFFIGLVFATLLAASIVILVERVAPRAAATTSDDTTHVRRLEAKIARLEAQLAEIANHLRPPSNDERPLPEGVTSRPLLDGAPTLGQHLSDLEGSLFDFEREIRRDLRHLYEALRRRLDRLESKGVPIRAPADAAKARPELGEARRRRRRALRTGRRTHPLRSGDRVADPRARIHRGRPGRQRP